MKTSFLKLKLFLGFLGIVFSAETVFSQNADFILAADPAAQWSAAKLNQHDVLNSAHCRATVSSALPKTSAGLAPVRLEIMNLINSNGLTLEPIIMFSTVNDPRIAGFHSAKLTVSVGSQKQVYELLRAEPTKQNVTSRIAGMAVLDQRTQVIKALEAGTTATLELQTRKAPNGVAQTLIAPVAISLKGSTKAIAAIRKNCPVSQ